MGYWNRVLTQMVSIHGVTYGRILINSYQGFPKLIYGTDYCISCHLVGVMLEADIRPMMQCHYAFK